MKRIIIGDSPLIELVAVMEKRKGDLLNSLYHSPNPDPFQYGIRVGQIREIDEVLTKVSQLLKGIENDDK